MLLDSYILLYIISLSVPKAPCFRSLRQSVNIFFFFLIWPLYIYILFFLLLLFDPNSQIYPEFFFRSDQTRLSEIKIYWKYDFLLTIILNHTIVFYIYIYFFLKLNLVMHFCTSTEIKYSFQCTIGTYIHNFAYLHRVTRQNVK